MPKKREKPIPKWSERLKELRLSTGKSQREFAEETRKTIGISAGAVSRLEVGDLPLSEDIKLKYADYFRCSPEYITGEDDCPYTGAMRALMMLSGKARDEMASRGALRALVSKDIPLDTMDALALKGMIDEEQLLRDAYNCMVQFLQEELRKAGERDEHPEELPGGAGAAFRELNHNPAVDAARRITGPMEKALRAFNNVQRIPQASGGDPDPEPEGDGK